MISATRHPIMWSAVLLVAGVIIAWPAAAQDPRLVAEGGSVDDLAAIGGTRPFGEGSQARNYIRAKVASPVDGTPAALTMSVEDQMRLRYQRTHFFPLPLSGDRVRWLAVRRSSDNSQSDYFVRTDFADASTCDPMVDMLAMAEQLEMPVIDLPDVPPGTGPIRTRTDAYAPAASIHGLDYELKAASLFYDTDTRAETAISGSDNTPLAAWARATMAALATCWSDRLPADLAAEAERALRRRSG